jgi:hypothetical protein
VTNNRTNPYPVRSLAKLVSALDHDNIMNLCMISFENNDDMLEIMFVTQVIHFIPSASINLSNQC